IKGFNLRYLQKKAFEGRLPRYVYAQRKKGFSAPIGSWLRDDLEPLLRETLDDSILIQQGVFAPGPVMELIRQHKDRKADHTDQLWALAMFQLWFRAYGLT